MATYFVTGATGFIGTRLVRELLDRPDCTGVYVLVRPGSLARLETAGETWPRPELVVPVVGDLTEPALGVETAPLIGAIDHVVHLAAVYDFTASEAANQAANVAGTANVIEFAAAVNAGVLHHVSSIAVAGDHRGRFTEADFDLGQRHHSPYHATKFAAEALVRAQRAVPYRIYRPAAVVGDSVTGEMDKIDGPYYFLPAIARLRRLPPVPIPVPDLGATNVVPVDYVVDAMAHLMHVDAPSGTTFHLTESRRQPVTEVYNGFAAALGAPPVLPIGLAGSTAGLRRGATAAAAVVTSTVDRIPGVRQARRAVLAELGLPEEILRHLDLPTVFDSSATEAALAGSGITLPPFASYADRLVGYWSAHLDPERARHGAESLRGRLIVITGASSGIGRATTLAVAAAGGVPLLVARRADELAALRDEIVAAGGTAHAHPCDLTDTDAVDALVKDLLDQHGTVDMLVNNAGRSIRRSVHLSVDRLHDYERTMALNYFAPLRLTLGLLPHMRERGFGRIVNVTTMGLQTDTPRFSAYLASKAALEAFGRAAGRELLSDGVTVCSVRMPLVRTPMIGATDAYTTMPAASPERAAGLVVEALRGRGEVVQQNSGLAMELLRVFAPGLARRGLHLAYQLMPESAPEARGRRVAPLAVLTTSVVRPLWRRLR